MSIVVESILETCFEQQGNINRPMLKTTNNIHIQVVISICYTVSLQQHVSQSKPSQKQSAESQNHQQVEGIPKLLMGLLAALQHRKGQGSHSSWGFGIPGLRGPKAVYVGDLDLRTSSEICYTPRKPRWRQT